MSLAEQISSLTNPVPVFQDPEDDHEEDTVAKVVDFEDAEYVIDDFRQGSNTLRVRTSALLDEGDSRYAGKKTSRKILDHVNDNYSDDASEDDESHVDMDALQHFKERMAWKSGQPYKPTSDSSETSDEEHAANEDNEQEKTAEDVQSKEKNQGTTMMTFSNATPRHLEEDAEKGCAIKHQLGLWDFLLKSRIQMQKAMVAANQLPRHNVWNTFRDKGGQNYDDVVDASRGTVKRLLDSLVGLQTSLLASNPETRSVLDSKTGPASRKPCEAPSDEEIPSDTEDEVEEREQNLKEIIGRNKRKLTEDEYPEFLHKRHCDFQRFKDATIQKWNERTKLTTGKMKSFDQFEQSTLKQIEHILDDKARLIRRTQLKRSSYVFLGKYAERISADSKQEKEGNEADAAPTVVSELDDTDVEVFDDNDFYHQILRELIERKTTDVSDSVALGRQWLQVQKLRSKMKKKVDTKASKGRKIRYDVHAKLVNFMAPIDKNKLSDEAKNELFNSLFGKKYKSQ